MLHSTSGETSPWRLFPILARMELDTKERTKFFGLARQRACAIGSGPRKGRSAFRPCTSHALRKDTDIPHDSFLRRGIDPDRPVMALWPCVKSVIRWSDRLHHGLFAFDVLHVLYINTIRYMQETFLDLLTPTKQKLLDDRVCALSPFRDPVTGQTSPKVTSLTRIGYLSGEQRVQHLFVWLHAIGSKAEIFCDDHRADVLRCISSLQVMCFSVRGKRPFTEAEHRFVNPTCTHDTLSRCCPRCHPRHTHTMCPTTCPTTHFHGVGTSGTTTVYNSIDPWRR